MKIYQTTRAELKKKRQGKGSALPVVRVMAVVVVTALASVVLTHHLLGKHFPDGVQRGLWKTAIKHGFANMREDIRLRDTYKRIPTYMSRLLSSPDLPQLSIDIAFEDMQKLSVKRMQAIRAGLLEASDDDYVPASISERGRSMDVKLRLKGDNVDHLSGKKWSFRIHIKGKDQLFGMRSFSIQHPTTRGFQGEPIFHAAVRQYGILAPRYLFVNVVVNGNDIGIMALEEFFSKELLERNGRKEGVILKFDESYMWASRDMEDFDPSRVHYGPFESYLATSVEAYQSSKISKSESLTRDLGVAVGLLRGFNSGALKASEVFDINLLGSYLAVSEFWGASHDVLWTNQRFYLNPLTLRLEPIAFDANLDYPIKIGKSISRIPLVGKMLEDPAVYRVFRQVHNELVAKLADGSLIEEMNKVELPLLDILRSEYFLLEPVDYSMLEERSKKVPRYLRPDLDHRRTPAYAHAYLISGDDHEYVEIVNVLPMEIEVTDIHWVNAAGERVEFEPITPTDYPFVLPSTPIGELPHSVHIAYFPPDDQRNLTLIIRTSVEGYEEFKDSVASRSFAPLRENPMPKSRIEEVLARHPFLSLGEGETIVEVATGIWQVDGDIVIPVGYALNVHAGTSLQFESGSSLVVYGATNFEGTEDAEIIFEGRPLENGEPGYWEGIAVFNAPSRSLWAHVSVRNTTSVDWPAWKLTGGATFYKSDVDIEYSTFSGAIGEDALNIIHSDFRLTDIRIKNAVSDGFDADFATGVVEGGLFQDIGMGGGGDGIDISGSTVLMDGTRFERVYDKAISVGEGSELTATNVVIENSGIGAASKDNSRLEIRESVITGARIAGLMTYVKKPVYGPPVLVAVDMTILDTVNEAQAQMGSMLMLNGEQVRTENIDVDRLYQAVVEFGKEK